MALVGKWTKIEQVASETETQLVTVEYPSEDLIPEDHPDFDKAGTTEEIEVPVMESKETVFDDVYIIVYSLNHFKAKEIGLRTRNQVNICWRVYENKEKSLENPFDFIYENHIISKNIDLSETNKSINEQAYDYLKEIRGLEELIND